MCRGGPEQRTPQRGSSGSRQSSQRFAPLREETRDVPRKANPPLSALAKEGGGGHSTGWNTPKGSRTPVSGLRTRSPGPLDDGGQWRLGTVANFQGDCQEGGRQVC